MKRKVGIIAFLLLASLCFADKWKATDFFYPARIEKMVQKYKLTKTFESEGVEIYKNEDTKDWMYIYREGSEDENSPSVYLIAFAQLGGTFDSCTKFGQLVDKSRAYKYLTSVITEANYLVPENDFQSNSNYVWHDNQQVFVHQFWKRISIYTKMFNVHEEQGLSIPENVVARYDYFIKWWNENYKNENLKTELGKEYKKYLKEHK